MSERQGEDLQFDRADYGAEGEKAQQPCVACNGALGAQYFLANDRVVCDRCAAQLRSADSGADSGAARFARATALGIVAAAIGAGIYFAIVKLTGYEIGLVAIVVGYLVGGAVRHGSSGRGGWRYQAVAIALTYAAIVATYVPYVVAGYDESMASSGPGVDAASIARVSVKHDQSVLLNGNVVTLAELDAELGRVSAAGGSAWYYREDMATDPPGTAANEVAALFDQHGLQRVVYRDAQFQERETWASAMSRATLGQRVASAAFVFMLAAAAPFLTLPDNIIGLLIIAIALFEAWRLNKRAVVTVKGPFQIAALGAQ